MALIISACGTTAESTATAQAQETGPAEDTTLDLKEYPASQLPVGRECTGLGENPWVEPEEEADYLTLMDALESRSEWSAHSASGLELVVQQTEGRGLEHGTALRVDMILEADKQAVAELTNLHPAYLRGLGDRLERSNSDTVLVERLSSGSGTVAVLGLDGSVEFLVECGGGWSEEAHEIAAIYNDFWRSDLSAAELLLSVTVGGAAAIEGVTLDSLREALTEPEAPAIDWLDRPPDSRQVMVGEAPPELLEELIRVDIVVEFVGGDRLDTAGVYVCLWAAHGWSPCLDGAGPVSDPDDFGPDVRHGEPTPPTVGDAIPPGAMVVPFYVEEGEAIEVWTTSIDDPLARRAFLGAVSGEERSATSRLHIRVDLTGSDPERLSSSGTVVEAVSIMT